MPACNWFLCLVYVVSTLSPAEAADDEASVYVKDSGDVEFRASTGGDIRLLPDSGGTVYVDNTQLITTGLSNVNFTDIDQSIHELQQRVGLLEAENLQLSADLLTVNTSSQVWCD